MAKELKIRIKVPVLNFRKNLWKITTILFASLFILSLFYNISDRFVSTTQLDEKTIGNKVVGFINSYLTQGTVNVSLSNVTDKGGIYEIVVNYQGNLIPVYVSKDGKLLLVNAIAINMEEFAKQMANRSSQEEEQRVEEIPKKDRPEFKLFIMSYCPYGIQAVKALLPVMKLLGNKADISVHFVNYIMHGEIEVEENLRQYCIQKYQKDKFYDYMMCFVQKGEPQLCLKESKVDIKSLESCMNELNSKYNISEILKDKSKWYGGRYPPFPIEDELNERYQVRGSPTIVVNDKVVYPQRSPEGFKEVLCKAFTNPPEECSQKLSNEVASPGIGPLTGGSPGSAQTGACG
ncbi:MAG: hypothetical protein N3D78_00395 [Candidatus Aenigmarchaeota archaeon]|nr:hypothetical protein [Candidatus Aenigmarchaeota archaeon]